MTTIALIVTLTGVLGANPEFYGIVTDKDMKPVVGASVFIEPGLNGSLIRTDTSIDGAYRFKDVPPGPVGLFVVAQGYAVNGIHVNVRHDDTARKLDVKLSVAALLTGMAVDEQGHPISGAKLDRAVILGDSKVGIPFGKLATYGIPAPESNARGEFSCPLLPEKAKLALKVIHPDYAQEVINDVQAGDKVLRVTLFDGVKVTGEVKSRGSQKLVAEAEIMFRNTRPPHDTSFTRSDANGAFTVRLKPGEYLYQAAAESLQSPAWEPLSITGKTKEQKVDLTVLGRGILRGDVRDLLTRKPISGARLIVKYEGAIASVTQTGDEGAFQTYAAEGANIVSLDTVDGYQTPTENLKVSVEEGKLVELPTFWLKALPTWRLKVLNTEERPVARAVATLYRPRQFGWRSTDADGTISINIASMPEDGKVRGIVEDLDRPLIGSFVLTPDSPKDVVVHVFPCAEFSGKVVSQREKELSGIVVGGVLDQSGKTDFEPLWRTVTDRDGNYRWLGVVPGEPQYCIAYGGDGVTAKSMQLTPAVGGRQGLGKLVLKKVESARSSVGETLKWRDYPLISGPQADIEKSEGAPSIVFFAKPGEADMVIDTATSAASILTSKGVTVVVAVDGAFACQDTRIPVFSAKTPGTGTTYLLDAKYRVVFETFELPPTRAIQDLLTR